MKFTKATKKRSRARIALMGPAGSGKTWNSLELAAELGDRIAVIDSERGSASKYSDSFDFDVLELDSYGPEKYVEAVQTAEAGGYDVVVVDSWSHAWSGKDGILERVDRKGGFSGGGWRDNTPAHNKMVDAILAAKLHVIVTLRVKTEYVVEKDQKTGKSVPRKVGLAPVQRDGVEYEFDVVGMLDERNTIEITKTRCSALHDRTFQRETPILGGLIRAWLTDGAPMPDPKAQPAAGATTSTTAPAPAGEGPKGGGASSSTSASRAPSGGKARAASTSGNGLRVADDPGRDLQRLWVMNPPQGMGKSLTDLGVWLQSLMGERQVGKLDPQKLRDATAMSMALKDGGIEALERVRAELWAAGSMYGPEANDLPESMGGQPGPKVPA